MIIVSEALIGAFSSELYQTDPLVRPAQLISNAVDNVQLVIKMQSVGINYLGS